MNLCSLCVVQLEGVVLSDRNFKDNFILFF